MWEWFITDAQYFYLAYGYRMLYIQHEMIHDTKYSWINFRLPLSQKKKIFNFCCLFWMSSYQLSKSHTADVPHWHSTNKIKNSLLLHIFSCHVNYYFTSTRRCRPSSTKQYEKFNEKRELCSQFFHVYLSHSLPYALHSDTQHCVCLYVFVKLSWSLHLMLHILLCFFLIIFIIVPHFIGLKTSWR